MKGREGWDERRPERDSYCGTGGVEAELKEESLVETLVSFLVVALSSVKASLRSRVVQACWAMLASQKAWEEARLAVMLERSVLILSMMAEA